MGQGTQLTTWDWVVPHCPRSADGQTWAGNGPSIFPGKRTEAAAELPDK